MRYKKNWRMLLNFIDFICFNNEWKFSWIKYFYFSHQYWCNKYQLHLNASHIFKHRALWNWGARRNLIDKKGGRCFGEKKYIIDSRVRWGVYQVDEMKASHNGMINEHLESSSKELMKMKWRNFLHFHHELTRKFFHRKWKWGY
jgi:hypothetical protein